MYSHVPDHFWPSWSEVPLHCTVLVFPALTQPLQANWRNWQLANELCLAVKYAGQG